ncbi:hypothetical protein EDD11_008613 [Mortierella claussenii]|nr:hypothetical protein EDD11_008613 [Mortierella claussenii]
MAAYSRDISHYYPSRPVRKNLLGNATAPSTLHNPYSPFDTSYKFLNPGTPRSDNDLLDTGFKTPTSMVSMLSQQQHFLSEQHPWSDMVFDETCMTMRPISPGISPPSSISSSSISSTPPLQSDASDAFRSRASSLNSDQIMTLSEVGNSRTHAHNVVFDPSKKSYHSEQDLPSLAPDSPTSDSLVPSDTLKNSNISNSMTKARHTDMYRQIDLEQDDDEQDMSDQHESGMDVDSNESNDEGDDEFGSAKGSRESSMSSSPPAKTRSTRTTARTTTKANQSKSTRASSRSKKSASAKGSQAKSTPTRKSKVAVTKNSTRASSTGSKYSTSSSDSPDSSSSNQSRKHGSPDDESPEAKRQKFLERNRMAASKCREKKRLQTLKTIADADAITARNQALHESLEELQEEVRTLKNQILCHRDCGCDVIQKFRVDVENDIAETLAEEGVEYDDDEEEDMVIDHETFDQLLEMDDDEERSFSKTLVWNYFDQAEESFKELDNAIAKSNFEDVRRVGHFLKGSSAALGVVRIKDSCEVLQHYASLKDADNVENIMEQEAETCIKALLIQMRQEYEEAQVYLKALYESESEEE